MYDAQLLPSIHNIGFILLLHKVKYRVDNLEFIIYTGSETQKESDILLCVVPSVDRICLVVKDLW